MTLPQPLGFPHCARCAYRINGTPRICAGCAQHTLQPVPTEHCTVCSQALPGPGALCGNTICSWPLERRCFTRVDAIAMYSGALEQVLKRYKYPPSRHGWAAIFGRLLIGWLDAHTDEVADIDLIIGNPTHPDRDPFQHIELMLDAAAAEDTAQRWPLTTTAAPVLTKTTATPRSVGGSRAAKMLAARQHADALHLHRDLTGQKILLVDDVFTTGAQIHTVAHHLLHTGHAREVRGLVLARVPWS